MNRRDFLITSGAAAAVAATPLPAFAKPARQYIKWHGRAKDSPHAPLVADFFAKIMADGFLITRGDFLFDKIKITDPLFHVFEGPLPSDPKAMVWNWMTGYTNEPGLSIYIFERGVGVGMTGIGTSIGYEDYWGKPRDDRYPGDYFVRPVYLEYAGRQIIEPKLPKGHIQLWDPYLEGLRKNA